MDFSGRDDAIRINSYTTVLRRGGVPHETFRAYWRDVHGPLCSRVPGLGWYVQYHFDRARAAYLWPRTDGVDAIPDYVLDGAVEIGFASIAEQSTFKKESHVLFADEQNVFDETVAYDLPSGSRTFVDRLVDPVPNGLDAHDHIHVHLSPSHEDANAFHSFVNELSTFLANEPSVLRLRIHLPEVHANEPPNPPAPDVRHAVPDARRRLAILDLTFVSPLARRELHATDRFKALVARQKDHVRFASAFAVDLTCTFVRDGSLTTAGLRGSRSAALITALGARNQLSPEVVQLLHFGHPEQG